MVSKFEGKDAAKVPAAMVLTWNSTGTRVLCPYKCRKGVHSHGTTLPVKGMINRRVAHCGGDSGDYRLLYPFEVDDITTDCWWILDREKNVWRTVVWNLYDPEKETTPAAATSTTNMGADTERDRAGEASVATSGRADEVDDLADIFARANVAEPEIASESAADTQRVAFVDSCADNNLEEVQSLVRSCPDLLKLEDVSDGQSALHIASAGGSIDIINALIEAGARSDTFDHDGNTAVLTAVRRGHLEVAGCLIRAGIDDRIVNEAGESAIDLILSQRRWQESLRKHCQMTLDAKPRKPDLDENGRRKIYASGGLKYCIDEGPQYIHSAEEISQAKTQLKKTLDRVKHLDSLLQLLNTNEATRRLEACLRTVSRNHGAQQEQHVRVKGCFDICHLTDYVVEHTVNTPIDTEWRTVACMYRSKALPSTFAVSGWSAGSYCTRPTTLDRTFWTDQVFKLAEIMQYKLPSDFRDGTKPPGSFYACHAEKQLLASFVFHHTLDLLKPDESNEVLRKRTLYLPGKGHKEVYCESPSLEKLEVNIYVCQPGQKKAEICADSLDFCGEVAKKYKMTLHLHRVIRMGTTIVKDHVRTWRADD